MTKTQKAASRAGGARSGPHTALVKACLHWLAVKKVPAWSNNTGAFKTESGGFFRASFPGCSDILGILPGSGKMIAVECKTGRGELTEQQEHFKQLVDEAGGLFLVVRSIDDLAPVQEYLDGWKCAS